MPAPPYFNALPLDGNNRRYVDQSAWDSVIGAFYAWPDNVNANTKNLSNLGVLTFGAGGGLASGVEIKLGSRKALSGGETQIWGESLFGGHLESYQWAFDVGTNGSVRAMTILSNGNVGIGTASPVGRLTVTGSAVFDQPGNEYGALTLTGSAGTQYRLMLGYNTIGGANYGWLQAVQNGVTSTNLILQPNAGRVGIGTANPGCLLDLGNISGTEANSLRVGSGAGYDSSLLLKEASDGYGFTVRNVNNAGLSIIRHHGDATGVSAFYIERATGIIVQSAPGSYNDSALFNRSGSLVVDEAQKKLYLRYKDSGGVCHSIELGGPYA